MLNTSMCAFFVLQEDGYRSADLAGLTIKLYHLYPTPLLTASLYFISTVAIITVLTSSSSYEMSQTLLASGSAPPSPTELAFTMFPPRRGDLRIAKARKDLERDLKAPDLATDSGSAKFEGRRYDPTSLFRGQGHSLFSGPPKRKRDDEVKNATSPPDWQGVLFPTFVN